MGVLTGERSNTTFYGALFLVGAIVGSCFSRSPAIARQLEAVYVQSKSGNPQAGVARLASVGGLLYLRREPNC